MPVLMYVLLDAYIMQYANVCLHNTFCKHSPIESTSLNAQSRAYSFLHKLLPGHISGQIMMQLTVE